MKSSKERNLHEGESSSSDLAVMVPDVDGPSKIIIRFKNLLTQGKLKPGARLPSERELAPMLGVSRPTLRQALKALHLLGILETKPRIGTYFTSNAFDVIREPLHFAVLLNKASNQELMDTRYLIEVRLAGLAAENATNDDLQAMKKELSGMIECMGKPKQWCQHEIAFHQAIARAAKNCVMLTIMEMLVLILYKERLRTVESLTDYNEGFQVHYRIFEQIQKGHLVAAEEAMRAHFDYLRARIQHKGAASEPTPKYSSNQPLPDSSLQPADDLAQAYGKKPSSP